MRLQFSVTDTGIGIAPEDRQRIFAPFTQADASTTRRYGGTGLGLTISQSLVELMGGRIWVESQSGKGSTFRFTVQFAAGASKANPVWRSPPRRFPCRSPRGRCGVLLAEDTRANQKLVLHVLGKRGHHVEIADDGRQALDLIERQDFDVVLMDVQMPRMDGFQVTAAVRKLPDPGEGPAADHCHDRPRPQGRRPALPGRRHGSLYQQARQQPGPDRGRRAAGRRMAGHGIEAAQDIGMTNVEIRMTKQ